MKKEQTALEILNIAQESINNGEDKYEIKYEFDGKNTVVTVIQKWRAPQYIKIDIPITGQIKNKKEYKKWNEK